MSGNLDKYLPEFDEEEARYHLAGLSVEELTDRLVYQYKLRRVIAEILAEPSRLLQMPPIPTAEDLRRLMDEDSGEEVRTD